MELPPGPRKEAVELLNHLAEDPRSLLTAPLEGYADSHKIYFFSDRYRMLVRVRNKTLTVLVFRIRRRDDDTYRELKSKKKQK